MSSDESLQAIAIDWQRSQEDIKKLWEHIRKGAEKLERESISVDDSSDAIRVSLIGHQVRLHAASAFATKRPSSKDGDVRLVVEYLAYRLLPDDTTQLVERFWIDDRCKMFREDHASGMLEFVTMAPHRVGDGQMRTAEEFLCALANAIEARHIQPAPPTA